MKKTEYQIALEHIRNLISIETINNEDQRQKFMAAVIFLQESTRRLECAK